MSLYITMCHYSYLYFTKSRKGNIKVTVNISQNREKQKHLKEKSSEESKIQNLYCLVIKKILPWQLP